MNGMKGRMAKVMYDRYAELGDKFYASEWNDDVSEILRAMREPTTDMVLAGQTAHRLLTYNEVKNIYNAMIGASLAEKVTK